MKKSLLVLSLISLISTHVHAQAQAITNGLGAGVLVSGAGVVSTSSSKNCSTNGQDQLCNTGSSVMTTLGPLVALLVTVAKAAAKKEELVVIKNDSILYVAGFEKSETLADLITELRAQESKLKNYNDHDIALALALGLE